MSAINLNAENSIVVFEMPMEIRTILPSLASRPAASRGTTFLAAAVAAAWCAGGGVLWPSP